MLSLDKVSDAVKSWHIMHPEAGYSGGEDLAVLAVTYHDALRKKGITDASFDIIEGMANDRCVFFPKIPNLLEYYREYGANPDRYSNVLQIAPEHLRDLTEEEAALNRLRISVCSAVINRKITADAGVELQKMITAGCVDEARSVIC